MGVWSTTGTLVPKCERGSDIHSDEWAAYHSLRAEGFEYETVNHQHNYVDPVAGAHTQGIGRLWLQE